jgi:hypothetical protein
MTTAAPSNGIARILPNLTPVQRIALERLMKIYFDLLTSVFDESEVYRQINLRVTADIDGTAPPLAVLKAVKRFEQGDELLGSGNHFGPVPKEFLGQRIPSGSTVRRTFQG